MALISAFRKSVGLFALLVPVTVFAAPPSNERLAELKAADDADFTAAGKIDWNAVYRRGEGRRIQIMAMLRSGSIQTDTDYVNAAEIYLRSDSHETGDMQMALALANIAIQINPGNGMAKWLSARAWDQLMRQHQKPQWYGTLIQRSTGADAQAYLYEIDEQAVTDRQRKALNVPSLAESRALVAQLNTKGNPLPTGADQADTPRTSLIIEGGGLPPNSPALERLAKAARVKGRIRIGYLPTASLNSERAELGFKRFTERLSTCGIFSDHLQFINLTEENAAQQADSPEVVAQITGCTAIFFGGGDQTRITRALQPDGRRTAALQAILDVWQGGGIIAGSSAGAAVQSATMISVSGLPNESMDEGREALDFGLTRSIKQPARRGLLVSPGLGFLTSGIVDQHFSQYRGRLGRLARAAIEERIRYGFGIDEDAALVVATDGSLEVLGPGCVTIVDTAGATCQDGPLGCSIVGVHLNCLQHGDRFDPKSGEAVVHPGKHRIEAGKERFNGNFPIPDIAGQGAVLHALISGLGDNTSRQQHGVMLKHHRHYGHGYRYTFSKTEQTRSYKGLVNAVWAEAVTGVRLDIEPVSHTLRPPESALPLDLPSGESRNALAAIAFRGIMLADDHGGFHPNDSVTRGELASAVAQTIRLEPARAYPPAFTDVPSSLPEAHEIALVVAADLMKAPGGAFRPAETITRQEAAAVLVQLAQRYRSEILPAPPASFEDSDEIAPHERDAVLAAHAAHLLKATDAKIRPLAKLTRAEAAEALYIVLGFPWADDKNKR